MVILINYIVLLTHLSRTTSQGGILNGWVYKDGRETDTKKDLVQPDENHLEGIPKFLQQPQSAYYVSKTQPVTITCIAQPVSHVNIFCADKQYSYMNEEISATGLRVLKMDYSGRPSKKGVRWKFSLEVKHKDVVEWFSEYRCYCEVWNQIELLQRVKKVDSSYATVYESYFGKEFKAPPKSKEISQGEPLKLTCVPPDAKPSAEIQWWKNGQNVTSKTHPRADISVAGQLLIPDVQVTDDGNYSCVATSQGIVRISSATVTIIENGQWSDWQDWTGTCPSECSKKSSCPVECSSRTRQKVRFCQNVKDRKRKCIGLAIKYEKCDVTCDSNFWNLWTEWSKCSGNPCRKMRKRQCTVNSCSSDQSSIEMINCTSDDCGGSVASFSMNNDKIGESTSVVINTHDIAMYVGLFVAVSVFLMVVVVIFCLIRRRIIGLSPHRVWRYSTTANGIPMFYPDKGLKKNLSTISNKHINLIDINQPSLYRSMVLPNSLQFLTTNHSDASSNGGYTDVGNDMTYIQTKQLPSLPVTSTPLLSALYNPPHIKQSQSDSKVSALHQKMCIPRHVSTLPTPDSRPSSDHYQELGNTDNDTTDLSENEIWQPDGSDAGTIVWSVLDQYGGRVSLPHTDIVLTCPPRALIATKPEHLFLATCNSEADTPKLKEKETLLSSIIVCGPVNVVTLKPLILTFPHCAHNYDSKEWSLSILASYGLVNQGHYWQRFIELDSEESAQPEGYCQLTKDKVHLMTNQLQKFCLIGKSRKSKSATKVHRIVAYCTGLDSRHSEEEILMRLYLVADVTENLKTIHELETTRFGSRLITNQKQYLCEDDAGNVIVTIAELSADWQVCLMKNYQEIPFQELWHSSNMHCSFTFTKKVLNSTAELKVSMNSLDSNWFCSIYVHQRNSCQNRQNLILSSPNSSPHTSLSATSTQFSSYSVGGGSQNFPYFVDDCNRNLSDPVFRITDTVRSKLSMLLDLPSQLDNDWRQFARLLSINRSLLFFSNKSSPTEILLDLWETQNSSRKSLTHLTDIFRKMGRFDCVNILERESLYVNP